MNYMFVPDIVGKFISLNLSPICFSQCVRPQEQEQDILTFLHTQIHNLQKHNAPFTLRLTA